MKFFEKLKDFSKKELLGLAEKIDIKGRHRMSKDELLDQLNNELRSQYADKKTWLHGALKETLGVELWVEAAEARASDTLSAAAEADPFTRAANDTPTAEVPISGAASRATAAASSLISEAARASLNGEEAEAQAAKFIVGSGEAEVIADEEGELPAGYGDNRLVLMVRDPFCLFAYWDMDAAALQAAAEGLKNPRMALRLRTWDEKFVPEAPPEVIDLGAFDIFVGGRVGNYYIHLDTAGRSFQADLGWLGANGAFRRLAQSKPVRTPQASPSDVIAEKFITVEFDAPLRETDPVAWPEYFATAPAPPTPAAASRLATPANDTPPASHDAAPPPPPPTPSPETRAVYDQLTEESGAVLVRERVGSDEVTRWQFRGVNVTSPMGSAALPLGASEQLVQSGAGPAAGGNFWLRANTEVIIYGATEPGAKVSIGGRPVEVRPDGAFEVHYHLQEGERPYPVVAQSADGRFTAHVVPAVGKQFNAVSERAYIAPARREPPPR